MMIVAGTVINAELAKKAMDVGSDFMLSTSSDREVLEFCRKESIKMMPDVFSPSEVSLSLSYGYSLLKLFPADVFSTTYIKSLKGPFPQTEYVAMGGVDASNYKNFLASGFIVLGIGPNLFPKGLISNHDWDAIRKNVSRFIG